MRSPVIRLDTSPLDLSHNVTNKISDYQIRHDRQIRAFGSVGQHRLRDLTVAVVGVGGAGSVWAQGLAHLGIGRLILVDPDTVDTTSLNRMAGARACHARRGAPKVEVVAAMVTDIDPSIDVLAIRSSVLVPDTWLALRCADVICGAVDGHAPRWALNALAVQYSRTYIDVASEIAVGHDGTLDVSGHVATVSPGGPCLLCLDGYDPQEVAAELSPDDLLADAKRRSGYLVEAPDEPSPSVLFLNQAVVAVALGEVVNQAVGWRPVHPYVLLDLTTPATTLMAAERAVHCPACGCDSIRGLGDAGGTPFVPSTDGKSMPVVRVDGPTKRGETDAPRQAEIDPNATVVVPSQDMAD